MSDEMAFTLRTSQTIGKIAEAMAKAQEEMAPASKDSSNPAFKRDGKETKYASLASCFAAIKPMHKHGIAVFQPPQAHGPDGVMVQTLLAHASGEWIVGELYMPASKKDPQGFGSALSYARRYCLQATTGLPTDDDDGNAASGKATEQKAAPAAAPAAPSGVDVSGLLSSIKAAKDSNELAKAILAVGRAKEKMSPEDVKRCEDARAERVRELAA